jgi:hypothetical protein
MEVKIDGVDVDRVEQGDILALRVDVVAATGSGGTMRSHVYFERDTPDEAFSWLDTVIHGDSFGQLHVVSVFEAMDHVRDHYGDVEAGVLESPQQTTTVEPE